MTHGSTRNFSIVKGRPWHVLSCSWEDGKTGTWVVLEAVAKSRIHAELKPGTTAANLQLAVSNETVPDRLACFTPKPGDCISLPAGTVHALGGNIVVFEVHQSSDVLPVLIACCGHPHGAFSLLEISLPESA